MLNEGIVDVLFEDRDDVEAILEDCDNPNLYECLLKYGLSTGRFLSLDYKGEEDNEIVNFILDYEFARQIELASQDELEGLGEYEYEFLPDKIRETNKLLTHKGYGLFACPSVGDYYILFISKLENKAKLLETELLDNELIPPGERCIKYYSEV
ncbi:DUF6630 family protein [Gorillibacterium massiliense]|uniref:DUF6630 family protein n=1 Tax=Gorillibacterium massiliense TaxID=1280390 RepID=UPI0005948382|nr:hypothetical protein [Gorillibacterium massiliense]